MAARRCRVGWRNGQETAETFPLAFAAEGEQVRIILVRGGRLVQRLSSMGIHCQDVVQVVRRQERGALLLAVSGTRYVLGGGMAQRILVNRS
jgi:ferrous iron transport protein A